ncbi:MAG: phosphoglycerate kinase [Elusimicrobia bacterium HGW-Elusimicrobia-1]|jgi:phosphoglycerate kinase|nr:MAG: phosphoglycerate kinase [Elusimicrobia bacterium HGW-Elusimicrobia-1]
MSKLSVRDADLKNKKVLMRADFNVPIDESGKITNDKRIQAAVPTIKHILAQTGASLVLMSHLGRPKGKPVASMSLAPVAKRLSEILGVSVKFVADCVGPEVQKAAAALKGGEVLLLENLRFHPDEEKNDDAFAKQLASLGEVFVQDAFGTVHRAHASTVGITKYVGIACSGLLVEKEIKFLGETMRNPARPFVAIIGGAKVSDKIAILDNLTSKVDALVIGGAMAYTFLLNKKVGVGMSLVEKDKIATAGSIMEKALASKCRVLLPIDHIIARKIEKGAEHKNTDGVEIPDGWIGVDIGPSSVARLAPVITGAKTILWNGPMGVFEIDEFANGTVEVAKFVAAATENGAVSVVGGGDSVSAVKKAGLDKKITHISTGGGASLEYLEGKELPGIAALKDK